MRPLYATGLMLATSSLFAVTIERETATTVPVQMTITVEPRHDKEVALLNREDVLVFQGKERLRVTNLVRCRDENGGLELFLLIDDASASTLGSQLGDLRAFIDGQPASTLIGIGYMRNGTVDILESPTTDRVKVDAALRLPFGSAGVMPSPFLSLSDLIKRWPPSTARHEVLLVTSGVDPLGGGIANPYLDSAIANAQRAGVTAYAIYTPRAGHFGHSFLRMNWGQNHLAQLAEETGGEAYMLGFGPPVSFEPYLKNVAEHLDHQYLVTFLIKPGNKSAFQPVRITTEIPNAEIVTADKIYVPAQNRPK
jgi:hypothetical protein